MVDHIASLLPLRVVLRDSCFDEAKEKMNNPSKREQSDACIDYAERKDCAAKLNFFEIFKQRTGWSEEEVRKNVRVI